MEINLTLNQLVVLMGLMAAIAIRTHKEYKSWEHGRKVSKGKQTAKMNRKVKKIVLFVIFLVVLYLLMYYANTNT